MNFDNGTACGRGLAVIGTTGRPAGHFDIHNGDESGFVWNATHFFNSLPAPR